MLKTIILKIYCFCKLEEKAVSARIATIMINLVKNIKNK